MTEKTKAEKVADVWKKYDANGNDVLDKAEAMKFLHDTMLEVFGSEMTDE